MHTAPEAVGGKLRRCGGAMRQLRIMNVQSSLPYCPGVEHWLTVYSRKEVMKLLTPIRRNGFWILRRHVPKRYAGFDSRKWGRISTHIRIADDASAIRASVGRAFRAQNRP